MVRQSQKVHFLVFLGGFKAISHIQVCKFPFLLRNKIELMPGFKMTPCSFGLMSSFPELWPLSPPETMEKKFFLAPYRNCDVVVRMSVFILQRVRVRLPGR